MALNSFLLGIVSIAVLVGVAVLYMLLMIWRDRRLDKILKSAAPTVLRKVMISYYAASASPDFRGSTPRETLLNMRDFMPPLTGIYGAFGTPDPYDKLFLNLDGDWNDHHTKFIATFLRQAGQDNSNAFMDTVAKSAGYKWTRIQSIISAVSPLPTRQLRILEEEQTGPDAAMMMMTSPVRLVFNLLSRLFRRR